MALMGLLKDYQDNLNSFGMDDQPLSIESYVEGTPLAAEDEALLAIEAENPVLDDEMEALPGAEMGGFGPEMAAAAPEAMGGGVPPQAPMEMAPEAPMGQIEESDENKLMAAQALKDRAVNRKDMSEEFQRKTAEFNQGGGQYGIG